MLGADLRARHQWHASGPQNGRIAGNAVAPSPDAAGVLDRRTDLRLPLRGLVPGRLEFHRDRWQRGHDQDGIRHPRHEAARFLANVFPLSVLLRSVDPAEEMRMWNMLADPGVDADLERMLRLGVGHFRRVSRATAASPSGVSANIPSARR